jgi:hypothetical protein
LVEALMGIDPFVPRVVFEGTQQTPTISVVTHVSEDEGEAEESGVGNQRGGGRGGSGGRLKFRNMPPPWASSKVHGAPWTKRSDVESLNTKMPPRVKSAASVADPATDTTAKVPTAEAVEVSSRLAPVPGR